MHGLGFGWILWPAAKTTYLSVAMDPQSQSFNITFGSFGLIQPSNNHQFTKWFQCSSSFPFNHPNFGSGMGSHFYIYFFPLNINATVPPFNHQVKSTLKKLVLTRAVHIRTWIPISLVCSPRLFGWHQAIIDVLFLLFVLYMSGWLWFSTTTIGKCS